MKASLGASVLGAVCMSLFSFMGMLGFSDYLHFLMGGSPNTPHPQHSFPVFT